MSACPHCHGTGYVLDRGAIGRAVRTVRVTRGWGVREMARKAQCSAALVSLLERGEASLSGPKAHRILTTLGIVPGRVP